MLFEGARGIMLQGSCLNFVLLTGLDLFVECGGAERAGQLTALVSPRPRGLSSFTSLRQLPNPLFCERPWVSYKTTEDVDGSDRWRRLRMVVRASVVELGALPWTVNAVKRFEANK